MATCTIKPALKPLAPITRTFSLPATSVEPFINRIVNSPKTLDYEITDNGDSISIYFVENPGYHVPSQPSYIYNIKVA